MLEKKEYGKLFNEGLYQPSIQDIMLEDDLPVELQGKGIQAYNASTDFKMIVSVQRHVGDNSEKSWNEYKGKNKRDFLCTSYIRNDMQGTIAKDASGYFGVGDELTFGFSYMNEESFLFSANQDARTDNGTIDTKHDYAIRNCTPNELIENMEMINDTYHNYNEIGYERVQDGQIKQPSYIVVSVRDGLIDVEPDILMKALKDWGGKLKIVIIDIDKCLESERNKVNNMIEEYKKGNKGIAKDILQKIKNNRHTDPNFCSDIKEIEEIKQEQYDKFDESESYKLDTIEIKKEKTTETKSLDYSTEQLPEGAEWKLNSNGKYMLVISEGGSKKSYSAEVASKKFGLKIPSQEQTTNKLPEGAEWKLNSGGKYILKITGEDGSKMTYSAEVASKKFGVNPPNYKDSQLQSKLPIARDIKKCVGTIATTELSRNVDETASEIRKTYKYLEKPKITKQH